MTDATMDFRMLYQLHAPAVRRLILFLGADGASADDIVAETFARAWTSASPLREESVKAYLFTIARNLHRRTAQRAHRHDELPPDLADESVSIEQRAEDRSDLDAALRAMSLLPQDDRAAILMRATEHMSYDEIARTLGLTAGTAKVRVHRARLKLMRILTSNSLEAEIQR
jgi:RNA polymerase sigma-70 factor (ECF subfamily)